MTSTSSAPVTTAPECCAGGKRVARVAHRSDIDDLAEDTGHGPGDVQDPRCRSSRLVLSHPAGLVLLLYARSCPVVIRGCVALCHVGTLSPTLPTPRFPLPGAQPAGTFVPSGWLSR